MIIWIVTYLACILFTAAIVNTWYRTDIKIYICRLFFRDKLYKTIDTHDDWENYLLVTKGKLGELMTCPICFSHWVSLLVSILALIAIGQFSLLFPIYCFFTIPLFVNKLIH